MMTVDEIRELINLAAETGVAELEVQRGDSRVRIRRAPFATQQEFVLGPQAYPASISGPAPMTLDPAGSPLLRVAQGEARRPHPGPGEIADRRHVLRMPFARRSAVRSG